MKNIFLLNFAEKSELVCGMNAIIFLLLISRIFLNITCQTARQEHLAVQLSETNSLSKEQKGNSSLSQNRFIVEMKTKLREWK